MNLFLLLLIVGNIAIGLGPLFIKFAPDISPFTMGFSRFVIAVILELIIIFGIWVRAYVRYRAWYRRHPEQQAIPFAKLIGKSLLGYYLAKNRSFMKGAPQITYLASLGFMIVAIVVPFYYLSFQLVGVVLSTILVNSLPILYIALFNWTKKLEEMDAFKVIYLILLGAGVVTITMSREGGGSSGLSFLGFVVIFINVFAFIVYTLKIGQDPLRRENLFNFGFHLPNGLQNVLGGDMRALRSFYKLIGIHLTGCLSFLALAAVLGWVDRGTLIGAEARNMLLRDLPHLGSDLLNPAMIALAIVCTLIPYFIQIVSSTNWPKHELGFDSWNSVLTVLQPLVGLYIGFLVWGEAISFNYIVITSIFLVVAIILRYFHESANFRLVLFRIRLKNGVIEPFVGYLKKFREIDEVFITFGKVGVIFHASFRSLPRLFALVQKIQAFPGIVEVNYYPEEEVVDKGGE